MGKEPDVLIWKLLDPEAKWGLAAKKFTAVSYMSCCLLGAVFTGVFYGALYPFRVMDRWQAVNMFFHGGPENRSTIPYYTVYFACVCLAFLLLKWKKLRVQRLALKVTLLEENDENESELSPMNAMDVMTRIGNQARRPADFMLLWRVERALVNLKNIGRVADVSSLLNNLAQNDEQYMENSYTFPKGLIWAIPVLGFIGTVLGLSDAIGGFGAVVAGGADLEALKQSLNGVTGGLATAFETTLIALVAALVIQLLMTVLQNKEEEFLDDCATYCQKNITDRLRLLDVDDSPSKNAESPEAHPGADAVSSGQPV